MEGLAEARNEIAYEAESHSGTFEKEGKKRARRATRGGGRAYAPVEEDPHQVFGRH
jgi:hypothetical protein